LTRPQKKNLQKARQILQPSQIQSMRENMKEMHMKIDDPVYGEQIITDPLAISIINTKEMQRLKGINQYGVWKYFMPGMNTTRFDHSLGVYLLLIKLGAGREEQIAGLIHDTGHTALSHVCDYATGRAEEQDLNDNMQESIIMKSDIKLILEKEGIKVKSILDHKRFALLEKDLPDLCADRLDYVLRDTLSLGMIKKQHIPRFIASLNIDHEVDASTIFFDDIEIAREITSRFMEINETSYSGPMQNAIYTIAGQALKIAVDKKIIREEEFMDTDDNLMEKLRRSGDHEILKRINMLNPSLKIKEDPEDYDFFMRGKCRYIDPFVLSEGKLRKLSEIDPQIKERIDSFRKKHSQGYYIKVLSKNPSKSVFGTEGNKNA
jgi:hypothetical protein